MTASQSSNGLQWSEVNVYTNEVGDGWWEKREIRAKKINVNQKRVQKKTEEYFENNDNDNDHHIKISLLIVHWGHALNNMLEITINDGQETIHTSVPCKRI